MIDRPQSSGARVCLVSASGQNVFFAELLEALGSALENSGCAVEHSVDRFPPLREGMAYLFVPHEYFALVDSSCHPRPAHLDRTIALSTEQPGTRWFEEAVEVIKRTAGAVDINPLGVRALRDRDIDARLMLLGYVPQWDRWGGKDETERPVDALFMGAYTERRARALASCASRLVHRRVELTITDEARPHLADSNVFVSGERRWRALTRAKTMINIHRGELGYLEWLRIVGAMLNGCVVLSEHSLGFEPLVPGGHFASVGYDRIPVALDALLSDPEQLASMRSAAYRLLRDELPLSTTIRPLVELLDEVASRPITARIHPPPVQPAPVSLPVAKTEYELMLANRTDLDRVKAGVKELVLDQIQLRRRLADAEAGRADSRDNVEHFGELRDCRVSIVLTVYNYAALVPEAIASVAQSRGSEFELVVIDDCSDDDSVAAVRGALARHPSLSGTLVLRGRNRGLPAARNVGIELARGEYVFVLDADNAVYPHALRRLTDALDADSEAAFAYGIVEKFDARGPRDLMSWQAWDPVRLRYGNYIDAMTMIRRERLEEVGGFTDDRRLFGWEDFDLWCSFADRGWHGAFLPEILARYRTRIHSMIAVTDIDAQAAWSALMERHPSLSADAASV